MYRGVGRASRHVPIRDDGAARHRGKQNGGLENRPTCERAESAITPEGEILLSFGNSGVLTIH